MKRVTIKKKAQNGLAIENNQVEALSSSTLLLKGKSHRKGGTDISYGGQIVEAEAGEPISIDQEGSLNIFGAMVNPVTGRKFKSDAKRIGEKEAKMETLLSKGVGLVNNSDPNDKWDVLKFNSGRAMSVGAKKKLDELAQSKEQLGVIQDAMLERADELGVDPEAFSKGKMKKVPYSTKMQNGGSLAKRNNNPGNLKYAPWMKKYGAVPGETSKEKDVKQRSPFAVFPSVEQGQQAMLNLITTGKPYRNKTVAEAINTWTGGEPYNIIPKDIKDKKIADLNDNERLSLLNTITQGEDSKLYNWENVTVPPNVAPPTAPQQPITPYDAPTVEAPTVPGTQRRGFRRITGRDYELPGLVDPNTPIVPSDASNFPVSQIIPELYAAATNRVEPVFAQTYSPDLFTPYSISLQDRRNLNNQTFRAVSQRLTDNPGALSTLAAQKYEADNQVNAEEFRINQGIQNDITNRNVQLLNDAESKNLQIADTQYVRQAQARSKTKATNQAVLNSISDKVAKHTLENRTLQVYENLYPNFRFGDDYNINKVTPNTLDQEINWGGANSMTPNPATSTRVTRDGNGQIKRISESTPSIMKQQQDSLKMDRSISKMLKDGDFMFNSRAGTVEQRKNNYSPLKGYDYSK